MLTERNQSRTTSHVWLHLFEICRICKSIETGSRFPRAGEGWRKWGEIANGYDISFGGDINVLKLIVVQNFVNMWKICMLYKSVNCISEHELHFYKTHKKSAQGKEI